MLTLYTLEDHIMKAWSVVDELETIRWMLLDSPSKASEDELDNALLGVQTLLNARFEMLFSEYEKVLKSNFNNMKTKSTLSEYIDSVLEKEEINDLPIEDNSRD